MKLLTACASAFVALTGFTVLGTPAQAAPYDNGNLYGAAQACRIPTAGLRYSNNRAFQSGRQAALNSRQNCKRVARTVSRVTGNRIYQNRVVQNTYR